MLCIGMSDKAQCSTSFDLWTSTNAFAKFEASGAPATLKNKMVKRLINLKIFRKCKTW